jgi:nucleotide-binding universal stress UspA family protein
MSNFLIEQERILEQTRQLSEQQELDRANGTELAKGWHPDVIKSADNDAKPGVFDANKERMPLPPRLQKPPIPTVEQLRQEVDNVGNAVQDALDQFEQDNSSLDAFYAEQRKADELVSRLEAQLTEARAQAECLRSQGSPKQRLLNEVCKLELAVVGAAGAILTARLEEAAQQTFHCSYDVLPKETQQALRIQFERLRRYSTGYAVRFGKLVSQGRELSVEEVQARAQELLQELTDLDDKELA